MPSDFEKAVENDDHGKVLNYFNDPSGKQQLFNLLHQGIFNESFRNVNVIAVKISQMQEHPNEDGGVIHAKDKTILPF
jgi:hypothetical protein